MNKLRVLRISSIILVLMLLAGMGTGCNAPQANPDDIAQAWALTDAGRWDEATHILKRYLYLAPYDCEAHYLLGQAYLYGSTPQLTLAQGELRAGIELFRIHRKLGKLEAYKLDPNYEQYFYIKMADAQLHWVKFFLVNVGGFRPDLQEQLSQGIEFLSLAKDLGAAGNEFETLEKEYESILKRLSSQQVRPYPHNQNRTANI